MDEEGNNSALYFNSRPREEASYIVVIVHIITAAISILAPVRRRLLSICIPFQLQ